MDKGIPKGTWQRAYNGKRFLAYQLKRRPAVFLKDKTFDFEKRKSVATKYNRTLWNDTSKFCITKCQN